MLGGAVGGDHRRGHEGLQPGHVTEVSALTVDRPSAASASPADRGRSSTAAPGPGTPLCSRRRPPPDPHRNGEAPVTTPGPSTDTLPLDQQERDVMKSSGLADDGVGVDSAKDAPGPEVQFLGRLDDLRVPCGRAVRVSRTPSAR